MHLPNRKTIRAQWYDYRSVGAYFITICTKNRVPYFGKIIEKEMILNNLGRFCDSVIAGISAQRNTCDIPEWVIMPDHIHLIVLMKEFTQEMNKPYQNYRRDALLGRLGHANNSGRDALLGRLGHAKSVPQGNYPENKYQGPTVGSIINGIKGAVTKFAQKNGNLYGNRVSMII